jgi:hypothetical protein
MFHTKGVFPLPPDLELGEGWEVASGERGEGAGGARCSAAPVVPALGEEVEEEHGNGVVPMRAYWCSEKLKVELSTCTVVQWRRHRGALACAASMMDPQGLEGVRKREEMKVRLVVGS